MHNAHQKKHIHTFTRINRASNIHFRYNFPINNVCRQHANLFVSAHFFYLIQKRLKDTTKRDEIAWNPIKMSSKIFSQYSCARFATVTLKFLFILCHRLCHFHCVINLSIILSCLSKIKVNSHQPLGWMMV